MLLANFVFGQSATIQLSGVNADDYYVHCSSGSYSFTALNSGITGPNITWRIDSTSNNVKPYVFQNIATPTLNYFQGSTEKIYLFLLKVEDASANIYWDTVRVAVAPKLTLSSFPTTWCKDDGNILLNQASIAGGTWSLTPSSYLLTSTGNSFINVSSITASTNILATYSHTYSFEAKSCVQTVNETVTVNPNPIVSFQGLPTQIFKCGTPVQLTGTPSGGTFTLNNGTTTSTLINGVFDPSNLTDNSSYTVTYSYTDPTTGCSAESAQNVFVAGLSQYVALKRGSQFGYLNSSNTFISSLTGISQIINTSFSPNPIYSVCGGLQSETFKLYFNPSTVSSFTSISINWGDGNSISPTFNAQNPEFIHTYVQAGFYTVTYTLSNATCSYTKSVNIFFGTIPGLSISLPSNATACLLPNDSIYYDFEIPNALTAPSGLIYSFSSNHDGTGSGQGPSKKFSTPFIDNGVSISPDTLIYDPINQTVSYRKWFWKSSCGFSSSQGGTWYNSFDFVVGVESPCGASGGGCAPVVLSTSPIAGIQMDTTVCANSNSTILDNSIGGQAVTSYQSNTACGSLNNGYWLIEPATFTVVSGALGSISPFDVNNPSSWNTFPNQIGSNSITIKFNNSGNYKVSRIIGVGINGLSSCTIDTAIEYICVDTIPIVSVPLPAVDTICQNGTILVKFDKDSVNCSEVSQYQIKAWTTTGSTPAVLTQTTASTDTAQILTLNSSGKYALEYIAVNSCGSSSIWDTIIVLDFPLFEFTNPSVVVCDDSALVTLGLNAYTLDSYNQYPVYDSMTYTISPSTGWNIISQNAYGLDDIQFYVPGSYTITVTIYSECGTDLAVLNLMINAPPVAAFSIPNESGCGASSFTPINTSTSPAGIPLQFNWSINANPSSGPYTISTDTSQSPLITIPAPSGDSVNYLVKLVVTDSLGCQDSLTLPYTSYPNPTAAFGINSVYCYPDTVQPIDASLSGFSNSAATYRWIVWDNGGKVDSAFTASPSFSFPNPSAVSKPYTLQLIVTNAVGCSDTISHPFIYSQTPTSNLTGPSPAFSCAPDTVVIYTGATGDSLTINWGISSIGTYTPSLVVYNQDSAQAIFPDLQYPDSDQVLLFTNSVTNPNNCSASSSLTYTIHARPLAKFGMPSDSCGVFALAPVDSSGSNSSITNWSWSISPSTGVNILDPTTQTPTFNLPKSFNGVQNYRIYLTVTDSNGCQDTTSRVFQVNPTPVASFALSTDSICTGTSLASILSNVSVTNDPADTTLTYLWSILNTSVSASTPLTSGLKVPTNTLVNTDTISHIYTLTLTVTNSFGCDSTIQLPLVVHPNAIAQIDSISLADCAPFTISNLNAKAVAFNNANSAYIWTILDSAGTTVLAGPSNTGINGLSYTINASNTYITIQLQAVSLFGCDTATTQVVARSYENPDPDWTFVQDTGCHVFTPAFANVNQTTGTHRWRIFDANNTQIGSTLSGASPALPSLISTNLTGLTVYTIEHHSFVSDTNSCDSVLIKNIYIKPNPIPTIVALPDTNCANETITFTGQSQNPSIISTWEWGINGITLYGTSVSYTFTSPGVYPLYLKTYTQDGCDTIVRDTITIHSYPYVDFQTLSSCGLDTVCVNQVFNLQNFSTSDSLGGTLTTYLWDILNDGTYEYTSLNPSHTFTAIGSYPIRLRVVNEFGCFTDTLHTIFVNSAPIATISFQDSSICGPVVPIFTEGGSGIIDSTHYELYAFNNAGSKVTLASWANTTPVLPPLVPNYYNDTLYVISKANFNCCGFSIDYDSIYIKTPPVANWSVFPDSGCTPVQIIFQLDGFVHGNADSAFIDFGDGSSQSFLANKVFTGSGYQYLWGQKSHVYTYSGFNDTIFIATLNVYNECGDSSISAPIYVQPNTVQASLQANKLSGCAPLTVQFTNTSYNATNVGWYFNWDPSSGTGSMTSNLNNPQWTFTTPGSYLVALAVDNGCGFDTAYTTITVDPSPTASFTYPSSICQGDTALFISTSSISNGNIVGYLWDFGDGDTSILQNPSHIFNASGSFDVTLIVTSYNGCQDSITHPVLVLPQPLIGFSYNDTCLTDTTYFLNLSTIPSGGFAGIFWDFGDGNVSNQWSPKHVYQAAGTYTVTLQLVSDSGCVSALAQDVDVYPLPNLSFAPLLTAGDSCSVPQTYTFNNTSTNTQQYLWDFDYVGNPGINTSTLTSPSFTYTTAGVYTVMLVGETGYGCRDTIFRNLLIRDGVIAQFLQSPVAGCQPLEVTFKDTSIYTASLDTILSITWDFGDGTSITLTDTPWVYTHTYVQYGTYFPTQTVTMASGCSDIIVGQMVQVYPTPVAGFSIQKVNLNTRQFLNQSITVDTAISYYWTFGDGSWSTEENPVHEYDPNIIGLDSIKICLRVTNSYGCVDSTCTTIWIWPPNLDVPNALAPGLNYVGEDAIFLPKGHSLGQYELEIFDVWGNVVFRTTELDSDGKPSEGWDGRDMRTGNPCAMGVYAWRIRAVFDNGERWVGRTDAYGGCSECGTLTLLR